MAVTTFPARTGIQFINDAASQTSGGVTTFPQRTGGDIVLVGIVGNRPVVTFNFSRIPGVGSLTVAGVAAVRAP